MSPSLLTSMSLHICVYVCVVCLFTCAYDSLDAELEKEDY